MDWRLSRLEELLASMASLVASFLKPTLSFSQLVASSQLTSSALEPP